jgi:hypothetical protein
MTASWLGLRGRAQDRRIHTPEICQIGEPSLVDGDRYTSFLKQPGFQFGARLAALSSWILRLPLFARAEITMRSRRRASRSRNVENDSSELFGDRAASSTRSPRQD